MPNIFDNITDGLRPALRESLKDFDDVDVATGYLDLRGWSSLADILDTEIAIVDTSEGAAYGAGLLAAVGAGWFPTVGDATSALVTATPVAAPGPDAAAYAEAHSVYRDLYPALAPSFHRM